MHSLSQNELPPHEIETLESEKLREEAIMMGLRLTEGLSCTEMRERFGYDILRDKADAIRSLTDNGYLLLENDHLKLAPKALFISDEVIVRVI
jgi:oxygen-independent coproporphyrinogen-3 oxidase